MRRKQTPKLVPKPVPKMGYQAHAKLPTGVEKANDTYHANGSAPTGDISLQMGLVLQPIHAKMFELQNDWRCCFKFSKKGTPEWQAHVD